MKIILQLINLVQAESAGATQVSITLSEVFGELAVSFDKHLGCLRGKTKSKLNLRVKEDRIELEAFWLEIGSMIARRMYV